jgi:hypothetical protein
MPIEFISAIAGLILTLLIFSYLIGDNALFRIAIHIFIGVSSGYAASVIIHSVLLPRLTQLQLNDPMQLGIGLIPFVLGLSLLAKLSPRISGLGSLAMALLAGVGAATVLVGAVVGTLIPQSRAAMGALSSFSFQPLLEGIVMLAGTIFTLAYFQFSAKRTADGSVRRNILFEILAWCGRIFIAITFGVLFAGVYMAALTAWIERWSSMINFVKSMIGL